MYPYIDLLLAKQLVVDKIVSGRNTPCLKKTVPVLFFE